MATRGVSVTERSVRQVIALIHNGVDFREIAIRLKCAPSTVIRIQNGKIASIKYYRCPTCGILLAKKGECLYCKLQGDNETDECVTGNDIKLELEEPELERYIEVRRYRDYLDRVNKNEESSFFSCN